MVFATLTVDLEYVGALGLAETAAEPFTFLEDTTELRFSRSAFEFWINSTISSSSSSQARRISAISSELACWRKVLPLLVVEDDKPAIFTNKIFLESLNVYLRIGNLRSELMMLHVAESRDDLNNHTLFSSQSPFLFCKCIEFLPGHKMINTLPTPHRNWTEGRMRRRGRL